MAGILFKLQDSSHDVTMAKLDKCRGWQWNYLTVYCNRLSLKVSSTWTGLKLEHHWKNGCSNKCAKTKRTRRRNRIEDCEVHRGWREDIEEVLKEGTAVASPCHNATLDDFIRCLCGAPEESFFWHPINVRLVSAEFLPSLIEVTRSVNRCRVSELLQGPSSYAVSPTRSDCKQ